jgi:hypothetical protein
MKSFTIERVSEHEEQPSTKSYKVGEYFKIDLETLEDLLELQKEVGNLIITTDGKCEPSIMVYDDYYE